MTGLLLMDASAGELREFAEKATGSDTAKPAETTPKNKPHRSLAYDEFGSGTYPSDGGSFLGGFWAWVVTAPMYYRHDDPGRLGLTDEEAEAWAEGHHGIFPLHQHGEATVPYVRADYNRQHIDGNISADDVRMEAGYKALAFHGRSTMYSDSSDGFELDINQFYGVLRYGGHRPDFVPGTFEAAIGVGISEIRTNDSLIPKESAGAITLPLKYHPTSWIGVEFRPAWYSWVRGRSIGDYDLSASVGYRFVQFRGGYRALWLQGEGIYNDGPYAGVSFSF